MTGLHLFIKFYINWIIMSLGLHSVTGELNLTANSIYMVSFQPLTLRCTSNEKPVGEIVTFQVNNVKTAKIKYFPSTSKCFIERVKNETSIDGGECQDECDCQLDGKSYIWSYNGTVDKENMTFTCSAGFGSDIESQTLVVYKARSPSGIRIDPNRTSFYVNETEDTDEILCKADCVPKCRYNWTTPNWINTSSVLFIPFVNRNQTGIYTCTAWNKYGSNNTSIEIYVQYRPSVKIIPDINPYKIQENDKNMTITCVVNDAFPIDEIWYSFTGPIGLTIHSQNYTISSVQKEHSGTYTCIATNAAGTSDGAGLTIDVLYGPLITNMEDVNIIENELFHISCNVSSNPMAHRVWWTRSQTEEVVNGMDLIFQNISRTKADFFTCHAENVLYPSDTNVAVKHSNNRTFHINVQYGPGSSIQIIPSFFNVNVTENKDVINITCQANCNPSCSYQWTINSSYVVSSGHLLDEDVHRSDAGNYTCSATTTIPADISTISVEINVLYAATILYISPITTVDELLGFTLECKVESFPLSTITWRLNRTNNIVSKNSQYKVKTAFCNQTGIYVCSAFSGISPEAVQHTELQILCSPRINLEYLSSVSPIGIGEKEPLNITVYFISNPKPLALRWIFLRNGSTEFIVKQSNCYSYGKFEHMACFLNSNVTEADFGIYKLQVNYTDLVIWEKEFVVEGNRRPDQPQLVNVSCGIEEVHLNWKSGFNGGEKQTFYILVITDTSSSFVSSKNADDGIRTLFAEGMILQAGEYSFAIFTNNSYGNVTSGRSNCTISARTIPISSSPSIIGAVVGCIAGILVLCVLGVAGFLFFRKSFSLNKGKDTDTLQRSCLHNIDEEEDELKDNPMYVSSGPDVTDKKSSGDVYSTVEKKKGSSLESQPNTDTDVYSQVVRKKKIGKEKALKKDKQVTDKFIEMGSVYENSNDTKEKHTHDVYANPIGNDWQHNGNLARRNKDGLIYADLDLAPGPSGTKFVIRGLENKNNYAIIDLTKTAEPLPSDSDSEDVNGQ